MVLHFFYKRPPKAAIGLDATTKCLGAAFGSFVYSYNIANENVKVVLFRLKC